MSKQKDYFFREIVWFSFDWNSRLKWVIFINFLLGILVKELVEFVYNFILQLLLYKCGNYLIWINRRVLVLRIINYSSKVSYVSLLVIQTWVVKALKVSTGSRARQALYIRIKQPNAVSVKKDPKCQSWCVYMICFIRFRRDT